jgi:magnesium-transporting ATPase (P-type)
MVTGDNVMTAKAIARECGILGSMGHELVMEVCDWPVLTFGIGGRRCCCSIV